MIKMKLQDFFLLIYMSYSNKLENRFLFIFNLNKINKYRVCNLNK